MFRAFLCSPRNTTNFFFVGFRRSRFQTPELSFSWSQNGFIRQRGLLRADLRFSTYFFANKTHFCYPKDTHVPAVDDSICDPMATIFSLSSIDFDQGADELNVDFFRSKNSRLGFFATRTDVPGRGRRAHLERKALRHRSRSLRGGYSASSVPVSCRFFSASES